MRPGRRSVGLTLLGFGVLLAWLVVKPMLPTGPVETGQVRPETPNAGPPASVERPDGAAEQAERPVERPIDSAAGALTELPGDVWRSPGGLLYGPGSREGHRLRHVLRHARDDPDRPGEHGVFDGDQAAIVALIDEAYARSEQGAGRVERDGPRSVVTVDLQRRVGYVGGQVGRRQGHPATRHVRLVLEGRNVITAYPLRP
ncbi:MAG: hypothetical protein J5I93_09530 [Pirellulaceae bacterium]|nr:hypothetical protein [Pirellulaceae bacterium]